MIRMGVQATGAQAFVATMRGTKPQLQLAMSRALRQEGQELVRIIKTGLRAQAPGGDSIKPISPITIALRGARGKGSKPSSKALMDSGEMWRSVKLHVLHGGMSVFVGVHRNTMTKGGKSMASIAEMQEFGTKSYKIPVTAKLRRWWMAMYIAGVFSAPLKDSTSVLNHKGISPRPWLVPAYKVWSREAQDSFARRVAQQFPLFR